MSVVENISLLGDFVEQCLGMSKFSERLTAGVLGGFMSFAGVSHLTHQREEFQAQVPDWFPGSKDAVVVASGLAEIVLGVGLLISRHRRTAFGVALAAFYTAIFPGNIAQYAEQHNGFGLDTDTKRFVRLPLQPVLIAGALHAAGLPAKK